MRLIISLVTVILLCIGAAVYTFLLPTFESYTTSGIVQAKEVKNASRFSGRVKQVLVKEGDLVKQGQELVIFDDVELTSKLLEARAQLTQARAQQSLLVGGPDTTDIRQALAQVQQAEQNLRLLSQSKPQATIQANAKVQEAESLYETQKSTFENAKKMLEQGIISQQKFNNIKAEYESASSAWKASVAGMKQLNTAQTENINIAHSTLASARAQYDKLLKGAKPAEVEIAVAAVEKAQSNVTALEAQLSETIVKAPIDGVVNMLGADPEELIPPNRPVVSIVNDKDLWADVYIPESKLHVIQVGQPVKIRSPIYKHAKFKGQVVFVNTKSEFVPGSNQDAGGEEASFRVKVKIEPMDESKKMQLQPGMKVDAEFSRRH